MLKKTISRISFENVNVIFFSGLLGGKVNLSININEIKSIYIKKHKINNYFYFTIGILLILLLLYYVLYISFVFVLVAFVFLFSWTYFRIRYRTCTVVLLLKNKKNYKFFFDNFDKYYFLEKIKSIRGKLFEAKFKDI
jgi:hypothetical protein